VDQLFLSILKDISNTQMLAFYPKVRITKNTIIKDHVDGFCKYSTFLRKETEG
jgi:hypothetical protein